MTDFTQIRLLVLMVAGWISREQASAIAYLVEENRVLKEQLEATGKRLLPTDEQRRRLAVKGKLLGRQALTTIATIVTPDTILRWHRELIAAKWTYPPRTRVRRPGVMKEIRELTVRMAEENPSWGYARIQGALKHLKHKVARSTAAKVSAGWRRRARGESRSRSDSAVYSPTTIGGQRESASFLFSDTTR